MHIDDRIQDAEKDTEEQKTVLAQIEKCEMDAWKEWEAKSKECVTTLQGSLNDLNSMKAQVADAIKSIGKMAQKEKP